MSIGVVATSVRPMQRDTRTVRDPLLDLSALIRVRNCGIYLGHGAEGPYIAPPERGVLVLGPPRSGKTSAVVIPNVASAPGPCVALSTKSDVLTSTSRARSRRGECLLFDPSGEICAPGISSVGWSPLRASASWDGAVLMAESMLGASHAPHGFGEFSHWYERAGALLSCALHAGALGGLSIGRVCTYLLRREPDPFLRILVDAGADLALDVLVGIVETDERERSGIWSTTAGTLAAYRTRAAQQSAAHALLDPETFLDGGHTLYVVSAGEHQRHAAPLIAGLLRELRTAAYRRARAGPVERPLLLVLDELAQIAPLHDLPALIAEGASQGVLTIACLQDLSQARARWGTAAEGFLSLFGVKLLLGGIGDTRTLEAVSLLAGEHRVVETTRSSQRTRHRLWRARSLAFAPRRLPRLSPSDIALLAPNEAVVLTGAQASRIRLTPYFADPALSAALA